MVRGKSVFTLGLLFFLSLSSAVRISVAGTPNVSKTGEYVLTDFGDVSTSETAQKTLNSACEWIISNGGGILVIPPTVKPNFSVQNTYQTDCSGGPTVTIIDRRNGCEVIHIPQVGQKAPQSGWYGQEYYRLLDMKEKGLTPQGTHDVVGIRNAVVRGATSYMQYISADAKKGKDVKIYVPTIRGIYVGNFLYLTGAPFSYQRPFDTICVKSIGWDEEKKLNYLTADLEYDHLKGCLLYNKHVTGSLSIDATANCDNQTAGELSVIRRQYSQGDSFLISGQYFYQGDVFSGLGDEMGVVMNAEVVHDLWPFSSKVESVDWSKDSIVIVPGACNIQKLAASRPIINMNEKKWLTQGTVVVIPPGGSQKDWGGVIVQNPEYKDKAAGFVKDGIDLKGFELTYQEGGKEKPSITDYDGYPIKEIKYRYKGKAYPSIITGGVNYLGGYIEGSPDCGWTEDVIGRFFAIADTGECLSPNDGSTGKTRGGGPSSTLYRWYLIKQFRKNPDGTCSIKIERIRWTAVDAGAPKFFNFDNYTWDGHIKPLTYIIAPGAFAYDVGDAWKDTAGGTVYKSDPRTIKLVPNGDRKTPFGFEPGDPIAQAIGPDPAIPTPIRVRMFNCMPDTLEGGAISLQNLGKVAMYAGIQITGFGQNREELVSRKDRKPSFENGFDIGCIVGNGVRFRADVTESAILFEQPNEHEQPMKWKHAKGETSLTVDPVTADMKIKGSDVFVPTVSGLKGISGTTVPANNLRGINISVPKGTKSLQIKFERNEKDAEYSVTVQPNWFTQDRTVKKTPEGFTVEFSDVAPEGAAIDWQLIR